MESIGGIADREHPSELFEIAANGKITSPSFTARKLRIW